MHVHCTSSVECVRRRSALQRELVGEGLPAEEQAKILGELEKR